MSTEHELGERLSFDQALCTIRYRGPLPDQKGEWLGVEWDDIGRGKHMGSHLGKHIFETLSPSTRCASFIRATRQPDRPRSFVQALRSKYADDDDEEAGDRGTGKRKDSREVTAISGKVVEEVGFERIRRQQAALHDLKIVVLDGMLIQGDAAGQSIATVCPSIIELDVSRNLFESWTDIADICADLKDLKRLKVSGLRLKKFRSDRPSAFEKLEELHMNDCLLRPDQIVSMLSRHTKDDVPEPQFPKLGSLSIAGNRLSNFDVKDPRLARIAFPSIKTLVLEGNIYKSLVPLCLTLSAIFPGLDTLSLQRNEISDLDPLQRSQNAQFPGFPGISCLDLSNNAISSPEFISSLPRVFPHLSLLCITGNTVYDTDPDIPGRTAETAFILTLARIPTLTMLNYSVITDKDRQEGELYYLSVAEKAFESASQNAGVHSSEGDRMQVAEKEWARYAELCIKYDRPDVRHKFIIMADGRTAASSTNGQKRMMYPPGTLGARLVTIKFELCAHKYRPQNSGHPLHASLELKIPRTFDVYRVKGVLLRQAPEEWNLKPLGFSFELVHGSSGGNGEDEVEEIPNSVRRIGDWLTEEVYEFGIRVKPREMRDEKLPQRSRRELEKLEELGRDEGALLGGGLDPGVIRGVNSAR